MEWITFIVFLAVIAAGLVGITVVRMSHTAQLDKLVKHQRRLRGETVEAEDVFRATGGAVNPKLKRMLVLAGLDDSFNEVQGQWIGATVAGGLVAAGAALYMAWGVTLIISSFIVGLGVGAVAYLVYLKMAGDDRQNKLTRQLPQVLDSMASSLKAGSSIMDIFRTTSEIAPEPIRSEFYKARGEIKLNKSLIEVIREMSERIATRDFKFFVQAVSISEQTGADLAEVVASIADTLRDRFRLRDLVDSITSQGKLTAAIVGLLPYGVALFYIVISPDYIKPLLENGTARLVICGMMLWEFFGIFLLWKIVNYEV
jgi:Flp pilus assembly protein TadB